MKKNIYKYIYRIAMGVLTFSFVIMLFVSHSAPFGLAASFSTEGLGSSLVLTRPDATASIGQKIAGGSEVQGMVAVYTVQEILRREGSIFYRVSNAENGELMTIQASALGKSVVVSVPLLGVFVQMLTHLLGVMTLIGLPLLMLFINYVQYLLQKIIPAITSLERTVQRESRPKKKANRQEREEVYEAEVDRNEYVTVLKPYNFRSGYSH